MGAQPRAGRRQQDKARSTGDVSEAPPGPYDLAGGTRTRREQVGSSKEKPPRRLRQGRVVVVCFEPGETKSLQYKVKRVASS